MCWELFNSIWKQHKKIPCQIFLSRVWWGRGWESRMAFLDPGKYSHCSCGVNTRGTGHSTHSSHLCSAVEASSKHLLFLLLCSRQISHTKLLCRQTFKRGHLCFQSSPAKTFYCGDLKEGNTPLPFPLMEAIENYGTPIALPKDASFPPHSVLLLLLFSHSVVPNSLYSHGLQHARLPCPSLFPRVCSNSCPLSQWCHPTISSPVALFSSCPQSFPASGSFPMSWLFASGGQSTRASASASVLPMSVQGWFPLGLTGLISLHSKRLSRVFYSNTIWEHQFFGAQPSLWTNSHICTWLPEKP